MKRSTSLAATVAALVTAVAGVTAPHAAAAPTRTAPTDYLVLFSSTGDDAAARKAIDRAGGTVTEVNAKRGLRLRHHPQRELPERAPGLRSRPRGGP